MSIVKTMTIDGFYNLEETKRLVSVIQSLPKTEHDFGHQIDNFNMVSSDADKLFSETLNKNLKVNMEKSGIFRVPKFFIHFEDFESPNEWLYVVALEHSTFNIFEHHSGAKSALDAYKHNYRNLFEWDLTVSYLLQPGQGIFFRPWLFHSFDNGLIQLFRMTEEKIK